MTDTNLSLGWPAPAKLNLFLHINNQRDDGYHELQTLFQFVDYCDYLDFRVTQSSDLTLHSNMNNAVADCDNLILLAAKSLQKFCNCQKGAEIWLDKRLPMGGGIGGGSSDAATTLVALNALWDTQLSKDQLMVLGLELGADVPVFINGLSAFAEGVGEKLIPFAPKEHWYLILIPDVHVSTAAVFQNPQLTRDTPKLDIDSLMSAPWKNDCQDFVVKRYPQVANTLGWLIEYAPSRMTGTGACIFGQFELQHQALEVLAKLPKDMRGFVAKGTNISPLESHLTRL
ncbi:4-(cytidine 5'-diphospho)-2-C-methyl-D-erythritol kinase [Shewanella psychropiezotolerans]|uniref:4-diphosphocytidyl-2-C-methyl-D-erythritol kinase n=1 Tax=Shewanella psychropiezotolerans TaxID=2593655 RepID=A0ABX5WV10_9GAMM|nr:MULTISPECIES: 4-(cytidine 5'-diphospho)-2-C-methyl-D-erythritol kinase [Shewanella]MPY22806.1 4-(cytidine 5'-diphospho)-2-C-methyl-D-erythritol kinase [Shewanella sp. YLB-07]QDO82919.1 4-(cytidine 5'-diphospho)-2-C-methyl-D-erythritol kinase [Shewanella psychropiezotolerans]